jgi:hypothetical protein
LAAFGPSVSHHSRHDFSTSAPGLLESLPGEEWAACTATSSLSHAAMMINHAAKPLFAWDCLEGNLSLRTVRELLAVLPDGKRLQSLHAARGIGRDDYPIDVLWVSGRIAHPLAATHHKGRAPQATPQRRTRHLIGIKSEQGVPRSGTRPGSRKFWDRSHTARS